ncbi:ABC transporter ATP-binding protein [Caldicellulosiruptor morganii]|uniref:ABC transporter ATP-binding protein n=1 Tax=Caldicellulosiruptor morganii TaxID=1387555 RepID=A0ABY7BRE7_9FIRM|nr:ABC transporter ATP-binding protein [Caldicellulosiruptor morganii]WAM34161.1 ABC transporter ATP-binding protein [Caldicellulosiruptor morganii]
MDVVKVENLVKRYKDTLALDNLSLTVKEGEIFGILGPNGAGKTTLINCILGLLPYDSGKITIFDRAMDINRANLKSQIGLVPQDIALYSNLTVQENLTFFGSLYNLKGNILKERIDWALEFVMLSDMRNVRVKNLSGGMKRRLNIACSILHKPRLLIMDEPTVGIDANSRRLILDSVKKLNKEGTTIIYTSHYIEEVEEICSFISIINRGRVLVSGTKEKLQDMVSEDNLIVIKVEELFWNVVDKLKSIRGVKEVLTKDRQITITAGKREADIKDIVNAVSEGSRIISMEFKKPTLEMVYLTIVGNNIKEEGDEK